jgi:hypothetical protein
LVVWFLDRIISITFLTLLLPESSLPSPFYFLVPPFYLFLPYLLPFLFIYSSCTTN